MSFGGKLKTEQTEVCHTNIFERLSCSGSRHNFISSVTTIALHIGILNMLRAWHNWHTEGTMLEVSWDRLQPPSGPNEDEGLKYIDNGYIHRPDSFLNEWAETNYNFSAYTE